MAICKWLLIPPPPPAGDGRRARPCGLDLDAMTMRLAAQQLRNGDGGHERLDGHPGRHGALAARWAHASCARRMHGICADTSRECPVASVTPSDACPLMGVAWLTSRLARLRSVLRGARRVCTVRVRSPPPPQMASGFRKVPGAKAKLL